MCEYISWKEMPDGSCRFLTNKMLYHTRQGAELRRHNPDCPEDWLGHGAIDFYYEDKRDSGIQRECTDFYTPNNFPSVIVEAIKAGEMELPGVVFPEGLLKAPLSADYRKKRDALDADYRKKRAALYADYRKKRDALYADYEKKLAALYADYRKKLAPLYAEMWKLFANPRNRSKAWK